MALSDSRVRGGAATSTRRAETDGLDVLTWGIFEHTPVQARVTTRDGGVSEGAYRSLNLGLHVGDEDDAVLENRSRALGALGGSLDDLVVGEQVHGRGVAVVTAADRGRGARRLSDAVAGVDALVTAEPGVVLAVLVADCAPVVLVDPTVPVLACAHAGWRGALSGILTSTVEAMVSVGARPERLLAAVGPAIAAERYEVGEDVAAAAGRAFGDPTPYLAQGGPGLWRFDLPGVVHRLLAEAGIDEHRIEVAGIGTGPPGRFFSARAEGRCGRFAALARLEP